MKKRSLVGLFVVMGLLAAPLVYFSVSSRQPYRADMDAGDLIIVRIENYKKMHGRLPSDLKAVGLSKDGEKYFYEKRSDDSYVLWFGTTLGESMVYSSEKQGWRDTND